MVKKLDDTGGIRVKLPPRTPRSKVVQPALDAVPKVSLARPSARKPFIDSEEMMMAKLIGPNAMRRLLVEVHDEVSALQSEIRSVIISHLPDTVAYQYTCTLANELCSVSPYGLCTFHMYPIGEDACVFCNRLKGE